MHIGGFQRAVRRWVASHASALSVGRTAFVSKGGLRKPEPQTEAADGVHAGLLHPVEASRFVHTNTSIPERRARRSFTRLGADRSVVRWNLARIREGWHVRHPARNGKKARRASRVLLYNSANSDSPKLKSLFVKVYGVIQGLHMWIRNTRPASLAEGWASKRPGGALFDLSGGSGWA